MFDFSEYKKMGVTFIKIPNDLFFIGNEGGSFVKLMDYNLLIVLTYLNTQKNIIDNINFSIGELINFCGLKPKTGVGNTNYKIREIVKYLIDNEIIYLINNVDIDTIDIDILIKAKVTKEDNNFTKISLDVIEKILNSGYRFRNKILTYWCYLHSRVYKKKDAGDNKAQVTWVSLDKISLDTGLSKETIMSYNDTLVKLGLLKYINLGTKKKGKLKEKCSNIYITIDGSISNEFVDIYLKEGVNQYKHYLKENGWTLIEKKGDIKNEQRNGI